MDGTFLCARYLFDLKFVCAESICRRPPGCSHLRCFRVTPPFLDIFFRTSIVGCIKPLTSILLFDVFIFMGRLNALGTFNRFRSPFVCFWIVKWSRLLVWGRVVFSRLASRITKIQTHVSHMSVKSPYRRVAIPPYPQRPSGFNIWRLMVLSFHFLDQLTAGWIKPLTSILPFEVLIFMGRLNVLGTFHRFRSCLVCFWVLKWSRLLVWGQVAFSRIAFKITKMQT